MIDEHEIPTGSRLYFGKSAKLKREIEAVSSEFLGEAGFEEIVTPFFSYHQHQSLNEKEIIRFSDEQNNIVSLRADSTLDVVRLMTKRLGRSTKQNKWFYIQPVFRYPNTEINQIGAEFIGNNDLSSSIGICEKVFTKFDLNPLVHISNIKIPKIIAEELNLSLDIFEKAELQKILSLEIDWLEKLACLQRPEDIDKVIEIVPQNIKVELKKMKSLYEKLNYKNVHFSPLYYVNMRYYDELFFRFIDKNCTLAKGGSYESEGLESTGFGLYTDAFIETLIKK
ncbi:ATP phosphoribosyltransferase regulatory subunit [Sulfurospirillum arcachonense]|uniref:ATP phosphoribosyltransferase regulatory subunit n=1 Tax=Sulfurospirillum arcachonense TaxID=57666 RepID=UPI000469D548|nr:ATP phosphoribosyltransferase regulatory subunit [Sulfurospirillum arcachonense]